MPIRRKLNLSGPALAFITTTAKDWLPVFADDDAARMVLKKLNQLTNQYSISIVAYVLMPSHLHMMLGFPAIEKMPEFMQTLKSLTSREIKERYHGRFRKKLLEATQYSLWKPRYDNLIIVSQEQLRIKMNYIHNNPVKDELVSNPQDWPYSSAADWAGGSNDFLRIDRDFRWL